jgi:hypothetical protein
MKKQGEKTKGAKLGQISIAKSAWARAPTRASLTAMANAVSSTLKQHAIGQRARVGMIKITHAPHTSRLVKLFEGHRRWLQSFSNWHGQNAVAYL